MSTLALAAGERPTRRSSWDPDEVKALCERMSAAMSGQTAAVAEQMAKHTRRLGERTTAALDEIEDATGRPFDPYNVNPIFDRLTMTEFAVLQRLYQRSQHVASLRRPARVVRSARGRRSVRRAVRRASRQAGGGSSDGEPGEPSAPADGARPEPLAAPARLGPAPSLTILVEVGELPRVVVAARSFEEEEALRSWLRGLLPNLGGVVADQLDGPRGGWAA